MTDIAIRAAQFVQKWSAVTLNEKAVAQTHFNELCALLGVKNPIEADPKGEFYRFEKPLTKSGGGAGFADVWHRDRFAVEYKTKGKYASLRDAYLQLVLYKGDLGNPPVLVTCDIENFEVYVEFTGYPTRYEKFKNEDLQSASTRELLRLAFTNPEQLRPVDRAETITEKAARQLAEIARLLERRGFAPVDIAPFFMKVLFALFAEDVHLLPAELMSRSIRDAIFNTEEFVPIARSLFQTMRNGGYFGIGNKVPRFNGWLFENDEVVPLNADELTFLAEAAKLDWASVEPAIFGTLFERSLDPKKRAQLGAHYTSRDDILLIVEPVLMAPLRREWADVQTGVNALREQWEKVEGNARRSLRSTAQGMLYDFAERLSRVKVLDPACGSGNFLYVALHQLKDLEKEVWTFAAGLSLEQPELAVSPAQFFGIEKNPFAAELAQVVLWIGYLQWQRKNGFLEGSPREPILQSLHTIQCKDAILGVDTEGRLAEPEWPEADVIIGNPPFLGGNRVRKGLGDDYVEPLWELYKGRVLPFADLVCYWFERAREQISTGKAARAGLLATQSIRGGANQQVLARIKETGNIFWAYADREWILDGAMVHVSMIGFDRGSEVARELDGRPVAKINADLTSEVDITGTKTLRENQGICFQGASAKSPLDISTDLALKMLQAPLNINGRPNSDVVRPVVGALELVRGRETNWTIDFGLMSQEDAELYKLPFEYVKEYVYPIRSKNRRAAYATRWWQYAEPRPGMRRALSKLQRYAATPAHSKYRIFAWVANEVLCNQATLVFARDEDYFFGILHSHPHALWARVKGTQLREAESGLRYTPSTTFETYPFPWAPGKEPSEDADARVREIADAARELVKLRDEWLAGGGGVPNLPLEKRTLTNLYNRRPDWLDLAHKRLDKAVFAAYGWPEDITDDEILERLLQLNLQRAAAQGEAPATIEEENETSEEEE